jgi:hypothetical protein
MTTVNKQDCNTVIEDLDMSPGTWQQILDSFYCDPHSNIESFGIKSERVESPGNVVLPEMLQEKRPGLMPETIDKDAYREFMRGL